MRGIQKLNTLLVLVFLAGVMLVLTSGCASTATWGGGATSEYGTPYAGGRYICTGGVCIDREDRGEKEDDDG